MKNLTCSHSRIAAPRRARMRSVLACAAAFALAPGSPVLRVADAAPTPAATASPAAAPLDALDTGTLRAHVDEQVTIHGTPTASGQSKSGSVAYLNFAGAHQAVSLVFFLKQGQSDKAGTADDLKPFVGKSVVVKGKLTDYKGDLQIVVESLDQIKAAP